MLEKLFYIPEGASQHAAAMDSMIDWIHVLMIILFVVWGGFFVYTLFRFRRSRHPKADPVGVTSKTNTYLEIGVAVFEAVLLIGFSIPLWGARVNEVPAAGEGVVVRLVAQQFAWNFWYPGEDGRFGAASPEMVDETTNPIGIDYDDPAAKDDITTINQLHLPVNVPVTLMISSKDVIHSFNQPHMRVKQDAVPGMSIPLWWVPNVTTAEMRERLGNPEFQYEIACAQLCGNSHYSMRGFVTVHTQEEYDAWLAEEASYLTGDDDEDFWN